MNRILPDVLLSNEAFVKKVWPDAYIEGPSLIFWPGIGSRPGYKVYTTALTTSVGEGDTPQDAWAQARYRAENFQKRRMAKGV